ncbi:MAG: metallophosphoesterase [Candidatus Marsarchaeota archaeon]|jgi:putative SbcD/Mre11-related phosphoesterase|nr:metallophosphoesterase [Candidatus Marsarchaeota archaeon]
MPPGSHRADGGIRFIYDEPAMLLDYGDDVYLVVGDLHIGIESEMRRRGVNIYDNAERMAGKILDLYDTFSANALVILGDIKNSVLRPDRAERDSIVRFFYMLRGLKIIAIRGNHDSYMNEIAGIEMHDELIVGSVAMLHGNGWPSPEAAKCKTLITGHNHIAVEILDRNGARYVDKAWMFSKPDLRIAKLRYKSFNLRRMVIMPAFNELITGTPIGSRNRKDREINPMLRNGLFRYKSAELYSLEGDILGTVGSLES